MKTNILIIILISAIFLLGAVPGCLATDRYVPSGSYPTIQAAVDASSGSDTIYVAAGTYTENINIQAGKNGLQLLGAGKENTIIEGVSGQMIKVRSAVTIQGFTIRPAPSSATSGIRLYDTADGTEANPGIIRDNKIELFTGYGIGFTSGDNVEWWEILDNEFCDCHQGIYFEDASHITVSKNIFNHVDYGCIGIWGCDILIAWNTFSGSDMTEAIAFCSYAPTNLMITHNTITGYDYGIHVYDCTSKCTVCCGVDPSVKAYCNNIAGNNEYGISNENTEADLDANNNWWGDPSGPSHSPGLGDKVSANVDFDPWLPFPFEQCPECGGVAPVPAFGTLGVFSLIGLLSAILVLAIVRKRD